MNIAKIPSVRVVFDRKHVATKDHKGLVQVEICHKGRRKWLSANVKLYKDQWDDRKHVVKSTQAIELNDYINTQVSSLEKWLRQNPPFSWEKLEVHLAEGEKADNFIEIIEDDIESRNDIKPVTKRTHRKLVTILKEYGKIKFLSDLTSAKIFDFDNWMHGRKVRKLDKNGPEIFVPMKQQTISDYHKLLKVYINRAVKRDLVDKNPYANWSFPRGESEEGRYLTEEELGIVLSSEMRSGSVARARDIFIFQSYTGLSYEDLKEFDFNKSFDVDGLKVYKSKREKTGETFIFVVLPKAMTVLEKYGYALPVTSLEAYNRNLKKMAKDAGLDKPISSHWARRTAAVLFVNHKIPYEVAAKILGHADMRTTAKFYARLTDDTIIDAMKKAKL